MDLSAYQSSALRTINPALSDRDRLLDAAAGLAEEASEVLGLIRKQVFQNREAGAGRLREELGDVLWCLAVTAHACGITLDEIAEANVAKLKARHPGGFAAPRTPEQWSRSHKE